MKFRREVEKFRYDIEDDLNALLYDYQQKLGIKYGDTLLDLDSSVDNILAILDDQYDNR